MQILDNDDVMMRLTGSACPGGGFLCSKDVGVLVVSFRVSNSNFSYFLGVIFLPQVLNIW